MKKLRLTKKDARFIAAHVAKGNHVRRRVPGCECAGCVRLAKLN